MRRQQRPVTDRAIKAWLAAGARLSSRTPPCCSTCMPPAMVASLPPVVCPRCFASR